METVNTQQLIDEIAAMVRLPYCDWKIGMANSTKIESESNLNLKLLVPNNATAIIDAYNHFVELGMEGKPPFLIDAKYIYFYMKDGPVCNQIFF